MDSLDGCSALWVFHLGIDNYTTIAVKAKDGGHAFHRFWFDRGILPGKSYRWKLAWIY